VAEKALTNLRTVTFYEQASSDDERAGVQSGLMALGPELLAPFAAADVYLCGPLPFMRQQWRELIGLGFSPTRLSREVFGPELLDQLS
jgi:nitric oxide dioxygenase